MRKLITIVFCFIVYSMSGANPYQDSLTLYSYNMEYVQFFNKEVKPLIDKNRATEADKLWKDKLNEPISQELNRAINNLIKLNGEIPTPIKVDTFKCIDFKNKADIQVRYFKRPTPPTEEKGMRRLGSRRNYKAIDKDTLEYYTRQ